MNRIRSRSEARSATPGVDEFIRSYMFDAIAIVTLNGERLDGGG
jgi:hypothetical protein